MNKYNYNIIHISGKLNSAADQLSRCLISSLDKYKSKYDELLKSSCLKNDSDTLLRDSANRIIIDTIKIPDLLRSIHVISGHREFSTMYNNIKNHLFIKNMVKEIKLVTESCKHCKK